MSDNHNKLFFTIFDPILNQYIDEIDDEVNKAVMTLKANDDVCKPLLEQIITYFHKKHYGSEFQSNAIIVNTLIDEIQYYYMEHNCYEPETITFHHALMFFLVSENISSQHALFHMIETKRNYFAYTHAHQMLLQQFIDVYVSLKKHSNSFHKLQKQYLFTHVGQTHNRYSYHNDDDLLGEPLDNIKQSHIMYYPKNNQIFRFTLEDVRCMFKNKLLYNNEMIPEPKNVENPYTREEFSKYGQYLLYFMMHKENLRIPHFIESYFDYQLNLKTYKMLNERFLIENAMYDYVSIQTMESSYIQEIMKNIILFAIDKRIIMIHNVFYLKPHMLDAFFKIPATKHIITNYILYEQNIYNETLSSYYSVQVCRRFHKLLDTHEHIFVKINEDIEELHVRSRDQYMTMIQQFRNRILQANRNTGTTESRIRVQFPRQYTMDSSANSVVTVNDTISSNTVHNHNNGDISGNIMSDVMGDVTNETQEDENTQVPVPTGYIPHVPHQTTLQYFVYDDLVMANDGSNNTNDIGNGNNIMQPYTSEVYTNLYEIYGEEEDYEEEDEDEDGYATDATDDNDDENIE
jgi:hypothetical protein